jgi:acetyl esterase/lipase
MPDLTKNPLKSIYTIIFLTTLPFRILYFVLIAIPRSLRPHQSWSFYQTFSSSILKQWFTFASTIRYQTSKSLQAGSDGTRFIVMPSASSEKYVGALLDDKTSSGKGRSEIVPESIGGMWYPRLYDPQTDNGKKVAIHFHGGAYVLGGCRPIESGWGPEVLARHLDGFVLQPQYRLAVFESSHFPAALQDGLTAYAYILSLGVDPKNLIISGDSAGGNLTLGLLRYLEEHKNLFPLPCATLLWSPWVDLSIDPRIYEKDPNAVTDYVGSSLGIWGRESYIPAGMDPKDPYLTPLGNEFPTSSPIFIQTGSLEIMHNDHLKFSEAMSQIKGNRVELMDIENAHHDTFGAGTVTGFAKELEDATLKACLMIKSTSPTIS